MDQLVLPRRITLTLAALLVLRLAVTVYSEAGIGWDFVNYYKTGNRILHGQEKDLYQLTSTAMQDFAQRIGEQTLPSLGFHQRVLEDQVAETKAPSVNSGRLGFIGFPISAYFFAPLAAFHERYALLMFKAQGALCFVAALFLLFQLIRPIASARIRKEFILPIYLGICLFYEPFWFVFAAGGQATPLNFLCLVLFHRFYIQANLFWAALFLSLSILIKPFFVLLLPILLFAKDFRILIYIFGILGLACAISILLLGWPVHVEWLSVMLASARGLAEPWWNNSAILGFFYNFWCLWQGKTLATAGEVHGPFLGVIAGFKFLIIALFFWLLRETRRQNPQSQQLRHHVVSVSILFALFFSNIVWPHYLAFLFVPLIFLLFSPQPLHRFGEILVWLVLISTLSVQSRFVQKYILLLLADYPVLQTSVSGMFGSGTLVLMALLLIFYHKDIIRSQWQLKLLPPADALE